MTKLLKQAFDEAANLDQPQQEGLARWLLDELASQRRWDELFDVSASQLDRLANESLAECRARRTSPLEL